MGRYVPNPEAGLPVVFISYAKEDGAGDWTEGETSPRPPVW
jgi:hypothetical protein